MKRGPEERHGVRLAVVQEHSGKPIGAEREDTVVRLGEGHAGRRRVERQEVDALIAEDARKQAIFARGLPARPQHALRLERPLLYDYVTMMPVRDGPCDSRRGFCPGRRDGQVVIRLVRPVRLVHVRSLQEVGLGGDDNERRRG